MEIPARTNYNLRGHRSEVSLSLLWHCIDQRGRTINNASVLSLSPSQMGPGDKGDIVDFHPKVNFSLEKTATSGWGWPRIWRGAKLYNWTVMMVNVSNKKERNSHAHLAQGFLLLFFYLCDISDWQVDLFLFNFTICNETKKKGVVLGYRRLEHNVFTPASKVKLNEVWCLEWSINFCQTKCLYPPPRSQNLKSSCYIKVLWDSYYLQIV